MSANKHVACHVYCFLGVASNYVNLLLEQVDSMTGAKRCEAGQSGDFTVSGIMYVTVNGQRTQAISFDGLKSKLYQSNVYSIEIV